MLTNTAKIAILASAFAFVFTQNAYAWPGQATVIVTVENNLGEEINSQAKLLGPDENELAATNVNTPPGAEETFILATNSTNIPGGEPFKVCVDEVCKAGTNGPPLKPENITITLTN